VSLKRGTVELPSLSVAFSPFYARGPIRYIARRTHTRTHKFISARSMALVSTHCRGVREVLVVVEHPVDGGIGHEVVDRTVQGVVRVDLFEVLGVELLDIRQVGSHHDALHHDELEQYAGQDGGVEVERARIPNVRFAVGAPFGDPLVAASFVIEQNTEHVAMAE